VALGGKQFRVGGRVFVSESILGEGATGIVHRVREMGGSGGLFAVKEMLRVPRADVEREVAAHERCRHCEFVLPLLAWELQNVNAQQQEAPQRRILSRDGAPYSLTSSGGPGGEEGECEVNAQLLFPLALGSLDAMIQEAVRKKEGFSVGDAGEVGLGGGGGLTEGEALRFTLHLARGLHALHMGGWAHRDVNPRNALLFPSTAAAAYGVGEEEGLPVAVLADLGSVAPRAAPRNNRLQALSIQEEAEARSSQPYRAPELWHCDADPENPLLGEPGDVWALGCTLFSCLHGVSPFECLAGRGGGLVLTQPCLTRTLGSIAWPACSGGEREESVRRIISRCLSKEPAQRPTLVELMEEIARVLAVHS